jgi:hypothetical protein
MLDNSKDAQKEENDIEDVLDSLISMRVASYV